MVLQREGTENSDKTIRLHLELFSDLGIQTNKKPSTESLNKDSYTRTRMEEQHQHVGATLER